MNNNKSADLQISKVYCQVLGNEIATIEVTYGLYSEHQQGKEHEKLNLCDKAAKDLWDKCATLVNLGLMHWVNKPVKN